jgi:hypothetical protein
MSDAAAQQAALGQTNAQADAQHSPQGQSSGAAQDLYQSGPATSDQFIRRWELTINGASGQTWTVSDSANVDMVDGGTTTVQDALRIEFQTRQGHVPTMGTAEITVYNLPLNGLRNQVKQFNEVILKAGYNSGQYGVIFKGQIRQFKVGRSTTFTETFLHLSCQDGYIPTTQAVVSGNAAAGSNAKEVVDTLVKTMTANGATAGKVLDISTTPFIRGVVLFGQTHDELTTFGQVNVNNGVVDVFKPTTTFPAGSIAEINAATGLVGMAETTDSGVEFTVLLNPKLQVNGTVHINESSINQDATGNPLGQPQGPTQGGAPVAGNPLGQTLVQGPTNQVGWFADTSADGKYTIWILEHSGDSRGNPWYTRVTSIALGGTPLNQRVLQSGAYMNLNIGPTPKQIDTAIKPP